MPASALELFLLFVSALVGGALNAVAGGGSFFTFPALVFAGVPPLEANATSAAALWPGSVSSAIGYRGELRGERQALWALGFTSLAGGLVGALLLVRTPPQTFTRVLPFLLLVATLVFSFGERLRRRLAPADSSGGVGRKLLVAGALQVPIAVYGGYFGGGMGLMMLAAFTVAGMTELHAMNGLKSALAVAINGVAITAFAVAGKVSWGPAGAMAVGALAGGFFGAAAARRLAPARVRGFVVVVAWVTTGYFFLRSFA